MTSSPENRDDQHSHVLIPIFVSICAIPISMMFWIVNVDYSILWPDSENHIKEHSVISPWRWLIAVGVPFFFFFWGYRKKNINIIGGMLGFVMGFILTFSSYAHVAVFLTFFVTGSKATKFRSVEKKKIEDVGSGERPIDFNSEYRSSWLSVAIIGAIACCCGDTWASELGTVMSKSDPFLITTWKRVPRGTNGAVSWMSLLCAFLGGLAIGLVYYVVILYTVDTSVLELSPPQWPIILVGGFGGFFGSLLDSILGATVNYSGVDEKGFVVKQPGKGVKYISGKHVLDNHSVNLLCSIGIALILPQIANVFWPSV
ncbi:transmembrane protein 19-like isoform X2 [Pseudomyrmex gracilis]|uniref:transmembrane protein 19-like isoform X2 n=1 Tax=Pseudomyrmex gracilis TaxID=219809 RepID=UPI0009950FDF|nr:transmembrane protein 19-like isoform X2 [Pseudomyrmex gracilis]